MDSKRSPELTPEIIAPCGMNCALCMAYQRKERRCPGCRLVTESPYKSIANCIIRNCPTIAASGSHLCHECERMPCPRLKRLDQRYRNKYGMSMLANQEEIRSQGMEAFLNHQSEKYTCPSCGNLLCVHRPGCYRCTESSKKGRSGKRTSERDL